MTGTQGDYSTPIEPINLTRSKTSSKSIFNTAMTTIAGFFTFLILAPLAAVLFDVARQGLPRLRPEIFTELPPPPGLSDGGFGHAIIGTLMTLAVAIALSAPIGILAAIYLSEFGRGSKVSYWVRFSANVLTGVPAILAGLFAYSLVVGTTGSFSAFAGGVSLAVIMLPIVMRTAEEGLLLIPREVRQAAVGLGATRFQTAVGIVLPTALPAIATAVTLAVARAAGEAAPLLFTALNNNFWSTDLFRPIATLPVLIYFFSIIPFRAQQELAWAAALVLLSIVLIISVIARLLARKQVY
ncbi:phosphate ABC transporter permease PstA [Thermocoleostomius sinensis]|uniref:Phosphate transport system permease protein PstA n=1 Tax=Thermocoleostomius sinensis A174 TaxID=2016057 RepID=A0A9E8ZAJ0_9CYAN|nr:phosphate ABC transporter permease PstA [Thermocoleostomius sinensis]WAL59605.1 phosphate ABC transporter permease PstA [Thermocoleostomius sinensis A174]